jgi:hypothetical protein
MAADVCSGPPVVSPSADGTTFAALQNASYFDPRWPMEDGDVPLFRTVDLRRAATVNVEWNANAVAMCPGTDGSSSRTRTGC